MLSGGARPAAGCPRSGASSNARSEAEETSGAHGYPGSLYLELERAERPYGKLWGWQSQPQPGAVLPEAESSHTSQPPHLHRLQDEKKVKRER